VINKRAAPTALPWAVLGLIGVLVIVGIWLALRRPAGAVPYSLGFAFYGATFLCPAPVGALIASRRPRHPIGWLMLAIGLVSATGGVFDDSARQFYAPRPELGAALWLAGSALSRLVLLLIGILLLLFPAEGCPPKAGAAWSSREPPHGC